MAKKSPKNLLLNKPLLLKIGAASIAFLAVVAGLAYASTLVPNAKVTVRVYIGQKDSSGTVIPLPGAQVELRDYGVVGNCDSMTVVTAGDGYATFTNCPVGYKGKHKYAIHRLTRDGYVYSSGSVYKKDTVQFTVKAYRRRHKNANTVKAYMSQLNPVSSLATLGYSTFILTDRYIPDDETADLALANQKVHFAFRTTTPDLSTSSTAYHFINEGRDFYFTAASSDFPNGADGRTDPLFISPKMADDVLRLGSNRGLYIHELVDSQVLWHYNATKTFDWNAVITNSSSNYTLSKTCCYKNFIKDATHPADDIDHPFDWFDSQQRTGWQILNDYAQSASSQGKKILWSEHSDAWQYLLNSALVQGSDAQKFFDKWGDTIVPIFATNTNTNEINIALNGAQAMANHLHGEFGESAQSFYFPANSLPVTDSGTVNMMNLGFSHSASYYEIQGDEGYTKWCGSSWCSPFMVGVKQFSDFLSSQ
jgi:hypothetical protein